MKNKYIIKTYEKEADNTSYYIYDRKIHKLMKDYKTIYVFPVYNANMDIVKVEVTMNVKNSEFKEIDEKVKAILSIKDEVQ